MFPPMSVFSGDRPALRNEVPVRSNDVNVNAWTPCGWPVLGAGGEPKETICTNRYLQNAPFRPRRTASSRHRAVREQEKQRPPTGLVKVVCLPFDGAAAQKHGRRKPTDASFETMLGRSSWVDSLFVWFPASWMPLVVDALAHSS